jgi:hypothetical protein
LILIIEEGHSFDTWSMYSQGMKRGYAWYEYPQKSPFTKRLIFSSSFFSFNSPSSLSLSLVYRLSSLELGL